MDVNDLLSKEQIEQMMTAPADGLTVSIFMPTHVRGSETQQDPIRLKNLVGQAVEQLKERGTQEEDAETFLMPAIQLTKDEDFWQNQSHGLALFLSSESVNIYRLPIDFEEKVMVDERFHIKPLLPLLSGDGSFYILALSQNEVRLFQGTRNTVEPVDLREEIPVSLSEALKYDDPETEQQSSISGGRAGAGDPGAAIYFGTGSGAGDELDKQNILRFFQELSNGVTDMLNEENRPLVLAGVEYLLPIYEEASHYPHLVEGQGVHGNPEQWDAETLHDKAWPIVEPIFTEAIDNAKNEYGAATGIEQAGSTLEDVVPAAHYSRVSTLFVAQGAEAWGTFDMQDNQLEIHDERQPGDTDLVDLAAVQSYLNGGAVYAVEPAQMPGGAQRVAAVFRY